MNEVTVSINGRSYTVSCDEGQEARVRGLGEYINHRVNELAGRVGQVGELRLMVMTALMLADELGEAQEQLNTLSNGGAVATAADLNAAAAVEALAQRVESITARLEQA